MTHELVLILPTYNEAENLEDLIGALRAAVPVASILVVDDGSPDGTGAIAERLAKADGAVHLLQRRLSPSSSRNNRASGNSMSLKLSR